MSYNRLMRQHATIEALADDLCDIVREPGRTRDATSTLRRLATLIRDHHAAEERILADIVEHAAGSRYDDAAIAAIRDVLAQNEDWDSFIYRWCPTAIAAQWDEFAVATETMVARMHGRHAREMDILYSLGVHYGLLETTD